MLKVGKVIDNFRPVSQDALAKILPENNIGSRGLVGKLVAKWL
jgi:hypothetical protein